MKFPARYLAARCAFVALLGAAAFAVGCGSSSSPASPSSNPSDLVTVFITNGVYSPNPLTMKAGQRVNWKNNDTFAHTATGDGGINTGSIAPTSAADDPVRMNTAGMFNFHCTIHSGENGSIVVQP